MIGVIVVGVIVMVAIIGVLPILVALNDGIILPLPPAARPMDGVLLLHVNRVPATGLVRLVALKV